MKTLPILLSFAALAGCNMAPGGKGSDISGTYVAEYDTKFSHVSDTIFLETVPKTGSYIFRSHGLITGELDGKPLAPQEPKTKPVEASYDTESRILTVGIQGDVYKYDPNKKLLTRGQAEYRRLGD